MNDAQQSDRYNRADDGFSLVELIVVVVILGILAAVVIPIVGGIQQEAEQNATKAVAASAATGAVADLANKLPISGPPIVDPQFSADWVGGTPTFSDSVCVEVIHTASSYSATSGPGC